MYHYFVADEPPVPQWPYTPPRDPAAVDALAQAYFDSGYDIRAMLRVLFTSDFFRSQDTWYEKVKSPADLMAGVLRLTGEYRMPERAFVGESQRMTFMGQQLANPPSVEGWHQGTEWVDTGTLVERINFATGHLGKIDAPGVRSMIRGVCSQAEGPISPEGLVDACLDQMGARTVSDDTKESLLAFASKRGDLEVAGREPDERGPTPRGRDAPTRRRHNRVPARLAVHPPPHGRGPGRRFTMQTRQTETRGAFLKYSHTIGLSTMEGRGFYYPNDSVVGADGRLYVVSRTLDGDNRGVRVTVTNLESEYFGTFGRFGEAEGQMTWPTSIAQDSRGRIFVSDEHTNLISIFDSEGDFEKRWGETGSAPGQIDGPSGLAFDASDNLYVVDHKNNRVQRFTADGVFLSGFGSRGPGDGQLNLPWGVTTDSQGDVYVADWRNDRIQRFSANGDFVSSYGTPGNGEGQLSRPGRRGGGPRGVRIRRRLGQREGADPGPGRRLRHEPPGRGHPL